jgi:glycosyltransferase involved in cell wall biosynthesis
LTLVTAFFRLPDRAVDEDAQFRLFDQLAASGLPILLFLDERLMGLAPKNTNVRVVPTTLESLWPFKSAEDRDMKLPVARTPEKDTRGFLLLQNAKIDLLRVASTLDRESTHFAWIDFGIMKVVRDPQVFLDKLGRLRPPATCVLAPGCWSRAMADRSAGGVNWRFCGGFLVADRASIPRLAMYNRLAFGSLEELTWEVNVWAKMERDGFRFDWYQADHDDSIVGGGDKRICLVMIVKNEHTIIERCLESALPHIDSWVITDTGSTDGTGEAIAQFFAAHGVPGTLARTTFRDFAQARNESLDTARALGGWDYALLVDADMVLEGSVDKTALHAPAYKLLQRSSSLDYWNVRLVRSDVPAKYVGVTHEYLSVEGPENLAGLRVDDRNDGSNRGDKAERDVRLLIEGLAAEPTNDRYMFYLANTYRETGRFAEAIEWYARRIALGGWDEEVWSSHYGIARCYQAMGDEPNFVKAVFDAYEFRPTRGEPLKLLARYFRERGRNESALIVADALASVDYPAGDQLFVEREAYDYGADQEIAIAGFYSRVPKRRAAAYQACADLTVHPNGFVREEARRNFPHYARSATDLFGAEVRPIDWQPGDGYAPMNPSVCVGGDRRLVLVRTVNYTVTAQGQYPTTDGSGVIRTRNHVVEFDADWKPTGSTLVEDVTGRPRSGFPVEGLEDCRLWQHSDGTWRASTTVRDLAENVDGRCEMAIVTLDEGWRIVAVDPVRDYEYERPQKNWMPIVGRSMSFLYFCDPTIVVERVLGATVARARSTPPVFLGNLRGGSQLIECEGGWLCLTHEVVWCPDRVYLHRFVKFDRHFQVKAVSDPFYFTRVGIEFCAGLALDGGRLVASFGVNDASAHLALLDPVRVDRSLRQVSGSG